MKNSQYFVLVLFLCSVPVSSISASATSTNGEPSYWPTNAWQVSTPSEHEMDNTTLQEMDTFIDTSVWAPMVDSLLIVRNGYIVYERYRQATQQFYPHHIYSCTKVVTSSLIGICLEEGYINSLDDLVLDYFPDLTFQNMDSRKENITIRHLLTMSAGLEWADQIDYYEMMGSEHPVEYVLSRPMVAEPGDVWNYNSGGSHVLSYIINNVSGVGTIALAESSLFLPLGIEDYNWYTDSLGTPNGGTLLYLTSRDMARIGFLYLNNGTWNSTQVLTKEWITDATQSHIDINYHYYDEYGYKWWNTIWGEGYCARGTNTQNILVVPEDKIIVVSTGSGDFPYEALIEQYILPSIDDYQPPSSPWVPWAIGVAVLLIGTAFGVSFVILKKRKKFPTGQ